MSTGRITRRAFLAPTAVAAAASCNWRERPTRQGIVPEVIDFHQHTDYKNRADADLVAHQRSMGVDLTVLLPAGSRYGLDAGAGRNDSVVALTERHPTEFVFFANELPDIPETRAVLERYLEAGARGIGEQKFPVACDSAAMRLVYDIARDYAVPVLLHFQHGRYNTGIERFHTVLASYPTVNFIGHAQTWWGNIDLHHDQAAMYPKTPVTSGGISDRLLADYPNMYGDLSAGSGLNALLRDEEHARGFLDRHQDRLLWASDCNDAIGQGPDCIGSRGLATVRRLAPDATAAAKILSRNAADLLGLDRAK